MKRPRKSSITLRQAFDLHYDKSALCRGSRNLYGDCLKVWERTTNDPPIREITNETLAVFRDAALKAGLAPSTVNGVWRKLRAILRRVGPPVTGNPFGLELIDRVPAMKPCKVVWKMPRRLPLESLDRFYVACRTVQYPMRVGVPAPQWWQALIVLAYTTGLRKSDLLSLTFDQFDFDSMELRTSAGKTGKFDVFPLTVAAVDHVQRIRTARNRVFAGVYGVGARFYKLLHGIQDAAGIERFGLHDVRRTAASEIDRVRRGMGAVLLQHAPRDVTGMSYVNATDELRECIEKVRMPIAFKHGPKMVDRNQAHERKELERELMRPERFAIASKPDPREFQFQGAAFWYRKKRYPMGGSRGRVFRALVEADGPVPFDALAVAITGKPATPERYAELQHKVSQVVSDVRKRLKKLMTLPAGWEPVPCVDLRGRGGAWTLCFPPASVMQN